MIASRIEDQARGKHLIFVRDGETHGYETIDSEIAQHAVHIIKEVGPDVSFVYFCGADEGGHGGDSAQERASFIIAHGIGTSHPSWPIDIKPEQLVGHILATL